MKRARVAPFEARPTRPREECVERAVKRQVDDLVEICKAEPGRRHRAGI